MGNALEVLLFCYYVAVGLNTEMTRTQHGLASPEAYFRGAVFYRTLTKMLTLSYIKYTTI